MNKKNRLVCESKALRKKKERTAKVTANVGNGRRIESCPTYAGALIQEVSNGWETGGIKHGILITLQQEGVMLSTIMKRSQALHLAHMLVEAALISNENATVKKLNLLDPKKAWAIQKRGKR